MRRRQFLAASAAATLVGAASPAHLIAHRGGVVDDQRPENSAPAIKEAIRRNYWMIEVDIRRTKDGEPVLHHDSTLQKYYGDPRRPEEMTWNELKSLRTTSGGGAPVHFEQACELCGKRMRLMLDLKSSDWPPEFYSRLLRYMKSAEIPAPIYSLGSSRVKPYFEGSVMVSANRTALRQAADRGENVARDYFLFELGSDLDAQGMDLSRALNVTAVAAINTFRYVLAKRDEWKGPAEDVEKLRKLGVMYYQVDSRYEALFR